MALTCAAKQRSRVFFPSASWAVEEALKTAKSSAAAANKYAIFLLSCLSGCQPFAVRSILRLPCQARTRSQSRSQSWSQSWSKSRSRFYAGFKLEKQQNGKQKSQTKRRTHINAIWCLCTSAPSTVRLSFLFFPHIPFDWISIWLQFFVSAEWWHGEISDSWMVNSLGFVGVSCGSFCCQPIELSAKFFGCSLFLQYWWIARLTSWWISLQNIAEYLLCMRLIHI